MTDDRFESTSWHDCPVWGWAIRTPEPDRDDWTSRLLLDIDYIVEWMCGVGDGPARFRIAPATLTFDDVTDLRMALDWRTGQTRATLYPLTIDSVSRSMIENEPPALPAPRYRWRIDLCGPETGNLAFDASAHTLHLRAPPIVKREQVLDLHERVGAFGHGVP